jgi:putative tricarboxylic transport membrane protein
MCLSKMVNKMNLKSISTFSLIFSLHVCSQAALPESAQCIAPAKPGGGFDLTCQLTRSLLQLNANIKKPLPINYLPGGIGALAFRQAVTMQSTDANTVIAFSSGSLLNIAEGRFGPHSANDVRWLVSLGLDHGVIAVRKDSAFKTLPQLVKQLHASPNSVVFGAGGSIGSQDWMKAALLAKAAGISHKVMRFVAFEGGGEAISALQGNHVQVLAGDAAEVARQIDQGAQIRVLAILSEQRLPGRWVQTPTAREQGYDIQWPIIRGLYMGKSVGLKEQRVWIDALNQAAAHPNFVAELIKVGMQPAWYVGGDLDSIIEKKMIEYRRLSFEFGVMR